MSAWSEVHVVDGIAAHQVTHCLPCEWTSSCSGGCEGDKAKDEVPLLQGAYSDTTGTMGAEGGDGHDKVQKKWGRKWRSRSEDFCRI